MIRTFFDYDFHKWMAMADYDTDGLTLCFADTELEAYEECFGYLIFEDLPID